MKPRQLTLLLLAGVLLLVVAACAAPATSSGGVKMENGVQQVTVISGTGADEYKFLPAGLTLSAGKTQITYENRGGLVHELMLLDNQDPAKIQQFIDAHMNEDASGEMAEDAVPGILVIPELEDVEAGTSQTSDAFELAPGSYMIACMKPGHYEAGMYSTFTITN